MQIMVRGKGGLTILIGIVGLGLQLLTNAPILLGAAVLNFVLGWYWNKPLSQAGVPPEMQNTVGGIPMQWISIVFLLASSLGIR